MSTTRSLVFLFCVTSVLAHGPNRPNGPRRNGPFNRGPPSPPHHHSEPTGLRDYLKVALPPKAKLCLARCEALPRCKPFAGIDDYDDGDMLPLCKSCIASYRPTCDHTIFPFDYRQCRYNALSYCVSVNYCRSAVLTPRKSCKECNEKCITPDVLATLRKKFKERRDGVKPKDTPIRDALKEILPYSAQTCLGYCESLPRCTPFSKDPDNSDMSSPCTACLDRRQCDRDDFLLDFRACRYTALTTCVAWQYCKKAVLTPRKSCKECKDRCVTPSMKDTLRKRFKENRKCKQNCESNSCSAKPSDRCKTCIKQACGNAPFGPRCRIAIRTRCIGLCPASQPTYLQKAKCERCKEKCKEQATAPIIQRPIVVVIH